VHVVITDSGVGGVSVCANAERFVRTLGFREPVRLTFVNAAPRNDYGYNSMPSRDVKLQMFDRFLAIVASRFAPDLIYIACNTLSVLLPDTPYARSTTIPVKGIVDTGVALVERELAGRPQAHVMIFATRTTIDAGTHARLLAARGVDASRIVAQACPGLADAISEDRDGIRTTAEIAKWVTAAVAKLPDTNAPVVACLACTHYGYRKQVFADALAAAGVRALVVDPNERAVEDIFDEHTAPPQHEVDVKVVTRYAIPNATVRTLTAFLGAISPRTVAALQHFVHDPELF
jgi:glutamate racemase